MRLSGGVRSTPYYFHRTTPIVVAKHSPHQPTAACVSPAVSEARRTTSTAPPPSSWPSTARTSPQPHASLRRCPKHAVLLPPHHPHRRGQAQPAPAGAAAVVRAVEDRHASPPAARLRVREAGG